MVIQQQLDYAVCDALMVVDKSGCGDLSGRRSMVPATEPIRAPPSAVSAAETDTAKRDSRSATPGHGGEDGR